MPLPVDRIRKLEVPIIVRLAQRQLPLREVLSLSPGAILELGKASDEELDLLVNNRVIGTGEAAKVGEKFGIRLSFVGDTTMRMAAIAGASDESAKQAELNALADQLLSGQA